MNYLTKVATFYYRYIAKRKLLHQYRYLNEVNRIMEEYLTSTLLNGGNPETLEKGRADLVKNQQEQKVNEIFINFLKNLK